MKLRRCSDCSAPLVRREDDYCGECDAQRIARVLLLTFAVVLGFLICAVTSCESRAHGQDAPRAPLSAPDRADVARCLTAEARPGPDYSAILAVLEQRSSSLAWSARHYCALFVTTRPSPRQHAIRLLPGGPSARIYAAHYRAALDAVRAWERGERAACSPDHFGDRLHDAQRARRAGWTVVDCGRTENLYFRMRHPRRVPALAARGGLP